jgi:hypothetical protein
MNDLPPQSRPVLPPDPDLNPTQALPADQSPNEYADQPTAPPPPPRQRLRDRLWSFRAVIAVALASVIVGGLGGAALASVSNNGDQGRFGPGAGRFNRGGPGSPPGMNGNGPNGLRQWQQQHGMGQRQWTQQGQGGSVTPPPGVPSSPPAP